MVANPDPDDIIKETDHTNLEEELRSCQLFLVDSQPERRNTKYSTFQKETSTQQ